MMLSPSTTKWVIYLLCFDRPVAGLRHYIGITTPDRLAARMIEHQAGRGAAFTQMAKTIGVGFSLARTFPCSDRSEERFWADHPKLKQYCPRCANGHRIRHYSHRPYIQPCDPADVGPSFQNRKTGGPT